jgi:hypothetical protein
LPALLSDSKDFVVRGMQHAVLEAARNYERFDVEQKQLGMLN